MATKTKSRLPRGLEGNPEWEAVEAARCSWPHAKAIALAAFLTEQYRSLWHRRALGLVDYITVLRTLQEKKVSFVLTGAYGIAGWTGRPRATHDVDILVKSGRNHARAVNTLRARYPQLEVRNLAGWRPFSSRAKPCLSST
jgi:hypothetical protein